MLFCQLNPEPADALRKSRALNTLENEIHTLNLTISDCGCPDSVSWFEFLGSGLVCPDSGSGCPVSGGPGSDCPGLGCPVLSCPIWPGFTACLSSCNQQLLSSCLARPVSPSCPASR